MRRPAAVLLLALALLPAALCAQVTTPVMPDTLKADTTVQDAAAPRSSVDSATEDPSPEEAGRVDGRAAGEEGGGVGARGATAFLIGVPLGFVPPFLLVSGARVAVGGGVGAAVVAGLTTKVSPDSIPIPPGLARSAEERGPAYEQTFRQSYRQRITQRRKAAEVTGGMIGAATGLAGFAVFMVAVVSHY